MTFENYLPKTEKAAKNAGVKALYPIGQRIRRTAMGLSRANPRKVRPAGKPYRRGENMLRQGIVFKVDENLEEVTVGYFKYIRASELHELGGRRAFRQKTASGKWKNKWVTYKKHPTLLPGLEKEMPKIESKFPAIYKKYFEK